MDRTTGFSLIELMVVVAIVAILASIAVPSYNDYILRGKLQEAYTNLSALRVNLEQYYQDNRNYGAGGVCGIPGGATPTAQNAKYFTYGCVSGGANALGDQTFTVTANGTANTAGFSFTLDQSNAKTTASVGSGWAAPAANCWVLRKDGSC